MEALFGGALALFVLLVAAWALWRPQEGPPPSDNVPLPPDPPGVTAPNPLCQCFDDGFDLAGSNVGVMSAQYRQGFQHCRAQLGVDGGEAFTAGWNARLSSKPYEASCERYLNGLL
jgi:hypothetical protein